MHHALCGFAEPKDMTRIMPTMRKIAWTIETVKPDHAHAPAAPSRMSGCTAQTVASPSTAKAAMI